MALITLLEGSATRTYKLSILDTTGLYSASNLTGFGGVNPTIAQMEIISLRVYLPNADTKLPDLTTYVDIDSPSGFPNTDKIPYVVDNEALGGAAGSKCPDGIYEVVLTLTIDDFAYQSTCYIAMAEGIKCCKNKQGLKLDPYKCSCGKARTAFEELCYQLDQIAVGVDPVDPNITHAARAIKRAAAICAGTGCINC